MRSRFVFNPDWREVASLVILFPFGFPADDIHHFGGNEYPRQRAALIRLTMLPLYLNAASRFGS
jgi:hypothetical protein